ncbi:MAG TPA: tail fiber domain-containing protein, partial [Pyrinomonadaceae bacterium]|nr:tail fiber domain-containing protein [Pyrinomonadaceae bacterium]
MLSLAAHTALAQGNAFTYQGRLTDDGTPSNGSYELEFKLYDAAGGGTQQPQPSPVTLQFTGAQAVSVVNGLFTVQLDFGAGAFPGAARYLEVGVRKAGDNSFTTLSPRQPISSTPYAIRSASAATATDFSGSLAGDVTGTQAATVVNSVGGQSAANVASGASAANAATDANTAGAIVERDTSGNFSAGTITAALNGNASTATTADTATTATTASGVSATAGDSVVAAVNAGSSSINTSRVAGDVELQPSTQQTASGTNSLINLKLVGSRNLGTPGQDALLSLSASGHYGDGNDYDSERFRVENDGAILSIGEYNSGSTGNIPREGAGTRFLWYPGKAAIRAGGINGTQWDDANIGLYSTAFGENVRALGDNSIAVGKNTVAANTGTIALGEGNTATGANSVALGYGASTSTSAGSPRLGTFVFADRSTATTCPLYSSGSSVDSNCQFHPTVTNSFTVRAVNGSFFYTNTTLTTGFTFNSTTATMTLTNSKLTMASDGSTTLTSNSGGSAGVTLSAGGGSWNSLSDRNMKANFAAVNPRDILRGVLNLPISTWNYKTQAASVRHIGPMAQDFFST